MYDRSFQRDPLTRTERILYWVSLGAILGLFAAEVVFNYEPRKLTALFFLLSWLVLVAIHEFGHALMAWICGWGVRRIVVGFGRPVCTFRIGETPVEFRTFPIEGFVEPYPQDLQSPRIKDALIYAAGPGIEILLAAALMLILGKDTLFSSTEHTGILAVQAFAAAAVTGAILNLLPMSVESNGARVPNDGLGILLAWRRPDEDYRARLADADEG